MPLVKKRFTLADGATSSQILQGTTYEYLDPGKRVVVAAACDDAGTGGSDGNTVTKMNFTMNNTELSSNTAVSALVTGQPFGWNNSSYVMNDTITAGNVRNRPVITFTNSSGATRTIDVAVGIFDV